MSILPNRTCGHGLQHPTIHSPDLCDSEPQTRRIVVIFVDYKCVQTFHLFGINYVLYSPPPPEIFLIHFKQSLSSGIFCAQTNLENLMFCFHFQVNYLSTFEKGWHAKTSNLILSLLKCVFRNTDSMSHYPASCATLAIP